MASRGKEAITDAQLLAQNIGRGLGVNFHGSSRDTVTLLEPFSNEPVPEPTGWTGSFIPRRGNGTTSRNGMRRTIPNFATPEFWRCIRSPKSCRGRRKFLFYESPSRSLESSQTTTFNPPGCEDHPGPLRFESLARPNGRGRVGEEHVQTAAPLTEPLTCSFRRIGSISSSGTKRLRDSGPPWRATCLIRVLETWEYSPSAIRNTVSIEGSRR